MEKQKLLIRIRFLSHLNDGDNKEIEAKNIVIATGSIPTSIPGVEITGDKIISSTEALSLNEVPNKLIVVGGGYIGLELVLFGQG